jgi:hypothetical protein
MKAKKEIYGSQASREYWDAWWKRVSHQEEGKSQEESWEWMGEPSGPVYFGKNPKFTEAEHGISWGIQGVDTQYSKARWVMIIRGIILDASLHWTKPRAVARALRAAYGEDSQFLEFWENMYNRS